MAKKCKKQNTKKSQKQFSRSDFEVRPVTRADKWCKFKSKLTESELNSPAPYGYIVVVPKYFDKMQIDVGGVIIKDRIFKGQLYLQVILKSPRDYSTTVGTMEYAKKIKGKKRKKIARYMNIRNMQKRPARK